MNDLEKRLMKIETPKPKNEQFKKKLHDRLVKKYHSEGSKYQRLFHYSLVYATFMMLFVLGALIYPDVALKINELAFKKNSKQIAKIDVDKKQTDSLKELDNVDGVFDDTQLSDKFSYTSIHHPNLKDAINPQNYKEDKAFIIRKYVSQDSQSIMIISEFDQSNKKRKFREVSF